MKSHFHIKRCGIVILAGGASRRLGSPKQLLPFEGTTLILKIAAAACRLERYPVLVVLGAQAEKISSHLNMPGLSFVVNDGWEEGMASSIRKGIEAMEVNHPDVDGLLFLVCDQPHLNTEIISDLIDLQAATGRPAAACGYGDKLGTPALFHKSLFSTLLQLKGDIGARKILENMKENVSLLSFEEGLVDIDTMDDYQQFLKNNTGAA